MSSGALLNTVKQVKDKEVVLNKGCVMGVNKGTNLNSRHGEIGDLKVNCDWSLRIQLLTLHTGQPKVCPHHVLLTTLHIQKHKREDKALTASGKTLQSGIGH